MSYHKWKGFDMTLYRTITIAIETPADWDEAEILANNVDDVVGDLLEAAWESVAPFGQSLEGRAIALSNGVRLTVSSD